MKLILIFSIILIFNNCSLNKDSKYWNENVVKKSEDQKKVTDVLKKSEEITNITIEEYEIYIDDYTKKSKYPDISQ